MALSRRSFLRAAAGVALSAATAELLLPTRTIFLPPRGGWLTRYRVTNEELADNLYGFGFAQVKAEGGAIAYDPTDFSTQNMTYKGHETQPADLTEHSLEELLSQMQRLVDASGKSLTITPTHYIIPRG